MQIIVNPVIYNFEDVKSQKLLSEETLKIFDMGLHNKTNTDTSRIKLLLSLPRQNNLVKHADLIKSLVESGHTSTDYLQKELAVQGMEIYDYFYYVNSSGNKLIKFIENSDSSQDIQILNINALQDALNAQSFLEQMEAKYGK